MVMRMPTRRIATTACLAFLLALTGLAGPAFGALLPAPKGKVYTGVSDNGTLKGFENFTDRTGKHPAILQTFHPWGNGLELAYQRWQNAQVRPMLHISTADDETRAELITPKDIARGKGDDYLIEINRFFAEKKLRAYIRPLAEPNRCLNPYSAVTCSGRLKGGEHSTAWYRKAFQRISLIVRGGSTTNRLDSKLRKLGMPAVNFGFSPRRSALPTPPVSIVWSPLPAGSPKVKGNFPIDYWPGASYVDWAGTDFYSNYPSWKDLDKFYKGKPWRGKPVSMTEWGVVHKDDSKFAKKMFRWVKQHSRVGMLVYYRGFGDSDPYNDIYYPKALNVIRNKFKSPRYLGWASGHATG